MSIRQFAAITMLGIALSASDAAPPVSRVPKAWISQGWFVLNDVAGDLNRDGVADLAFVLARKDEKPTDAVSKPRRLVVAFREQGDYRRVLTDDEVISPANEVTPKGDPFGELRVERGSLVIQHYQDTSSSNVMLVGRYRWLEGAFRQVGWTASNAGRDSDWKHLESREFDANLRTGLIEESKARWRIDADRREIDTSRQVRGYPQKRRYHLVPVLTLRALPTPLAAPLSARTVRLADGADVILGRERWKGASDLSATLSAAVVGRGDQARFYVRGLVHDSSNAATGEVRRVDARGVTVHPERIERAAVPGGYAWQARYPAASQKLGTDFEGSFEVISRKQSGEERLVISTARSRKQRGRLWLTTPKLPRLGVPADPLFYFEFDEQ